MNYRKLAAELLSTQAELHLASIDRQMSRFSRGMYFALQFLTTHDGIAHPRDLSQGMSVSSARVAALLNRMEERRLIRRETDVNDNRQVVITVTEAGTCLLREMREELLDGVAQALESIGPEDAEAYLRIQRKMVDALVPRKQHSSPADKLLRKDADALV